MALPSLGKHKRSTHSFQKGGYQLHNNDVYSLSGLQ